MKADVQLKVILAVSAFLLAATSIAAPAIRCVPNASVSITCQFGYGTIGAAVAAASAGDVLMIGPGTYAESVSIPTALTGITLLGAQAGVDPRLDTRNNAAAESVIDASSQSNSALIVQATNVVIDGFTVQGGVNGNGTGIDLKGNFTTLTPATGAVVLNNIVQNNATGISLNSEGIPPAFVSDVVIHQNVIRNNNAASTGDGIFTSSCQNVTISDNSFSGNLRLAIGINNSTGVTISDNVSSGDARFAVFTSTSHSAVVRNTGTNLVVSTAFSEPSDPAYILLGYGNSYMNLSNNTFTGGESGSQVRGVQVGGYATNPTNTNVTISGNSTVSMPGYGIYAQPAMLSSSVITGNHITGSGTDGIFVDSTNRGNRVSRNSSANDGVEDYVDNSVGSATAGTANVWVGNIGLKRTPAGISRPLPRGDFNADGKTDVVWRNGSTGQNALWLMTGPAVMTTVSLPVTDDPSWTVGAVGDFDGDGQMDVLWRNAGTGQVGVWLMNGTTLRTAATLSMTMPSSWQIVGAGDVNHDGKADVFWWNPTTGDVAVWLMNGTTASGNTVATVSSTNWHAVGVGDFNGDGISDLFWRNVATGENGIWFMNGASIGSTALTNAVSDLNWQVAGIGDANGDGMSDVFWRHAVTGDVAVWLMNGASAAGAVVGTVADANWHIEAVGDFDGDFDADLIWRNVTTGAVDVWLMNGSSIKQSGQVTASSDLNWSIVAPR